MPKMGVGDSTKLNKGKARASTLLTLANIVSVTKETSFYLISYKSKESARLHILNCHVFRYYMSPDGEYLEYPKPNNPKDKSRINSKKIQDYGTDAFDNSKLTESDTNYSIDTDKIEIQIDKNEATITVVDKRTNKEVLKEATALSYDYFDSTQTLTQRDDEYFFGGGMQNGRFTHKHTEIKIENTNNWVDGGVASPCPFFWSSYGYGVLRNTWQPGVYDFTLDDSKAIASCHLEDYFDAFFFISPQPKDIFADFFELTGKPFLMPEYAFYEAHLNAFNRDYWIEVNKDTDGARFFEDGKYYKSYKPDQIGDKNGILESLNGENNNYQFSARAVINRYKKHDMPLGWFVPNDGYGSGYGQTDSLDGDIKNLTDFADFARATGVEVALWTESNLHPADPANPKKGERDIDKEVGIAGVVALKADVAWIGEGYSFALSAIENAAETFSKVSTRRPMALMVDGWAGTQRCSGIWSGDQTGGEWEYIRFHIPTYIGAGLSGQPVIGSDMDGIYGGKLKEVNVRDYQWKAFTPLQLNMDGWGWIPKTPFSFDDEAVDINRAYLKQKSQFMPYNYTIAHESTNGLPMVRAMFLEFPNEESAFTKDSQYQFMWGPSLLIAPVYNDEQFTNGDSKRHGLYLPDPNQVWIDFFTGEKYQGGRILNDVKVPLWKLPLFIKDGAIVPMVNANNNPKEIRRDRRIFNLYPSGESNFEVYEDDGVSTDYKEKRFATTRIKVLGPVNEIGHLFIAIEPAKGEYKQMVLERTTELRIMASEDVRSIKVAIDGENTKLVKAKSKTEYEENEDVYFFDKEYVVNPYLTYVNEAPIYQKFLLIKIRKLKITKNALHIKIKNFINHSEIFGASTFIDESIDVPMLTINENETTATSISVICKLVDGITCYEVERDGVLFSHIKQTETTFDSFRYETEHTFRIRSRTYQGVSQWSPYIVGKTKQDPYKHTVKGVSVTCNLPCQPNQEIHKLTDGDCNSIWHTRWGDSGRCDPAKEVIYLRFDLNKTYKIDKAEYHPRSDGGNGNFQRIQYRVSDNDSFSDWSDVIVWNRDAEVKTIDLHGAPVRCMEVKVLESVRDYGSGRMMLFYEMTD